MDIQETIDKIKKMQNEKRKIIRYDFNLTERIVKRLNSFKECKECENYLNEFSCVLDDMKDDSSIHKDYSRLLSNVLEHLKKTHGLVKPGYYKSTYMAYGASLGLLYGVVLSQIVDNVGLIGIGLPIGIAMGISLGSKKDDEAKKEGLVI